ncbi:DUF3105 domain-containing protein [Marinactinospora thermotolerans]|uniref:DUF3105 domain-containing protein n=1 Tax=Marinactinospora thermotolerans DSM 45154 TaxID=1122192 RepID=A0A1T4SSQ3_9ACTN|nr:DUF3105 domain-containing protein [Marinactinospora thermotolerans]SKA31186.1 Protein of unknown function [Marinactinospora thermotolerans DSM 45154]
MLGAAALVVVLLVGAGATVLLLGGGASGPHPGLAEGRSEAGDIDGVQTFDGLSMNHVTGTVDYPQNPPVGGDHAAVWLNCGVYAEEVPAENAVHSLEHGVVWITYDPTIDDGQVDLLTGLYRPGSYLLVSPVPGLPAPVVASAWGKQLGVDDAGDPRLQEFIARYEQGPQTPEPGAPCSEGMGEPSVGEAGSIGV